MWINFFFPPKCAVCEKYLEDHNYLICDECAENILAVDQIPEVKPPIKTVWRITEYKKGSREMLRQIKFNKDIKPISVINKIIAAAINGNQNLNGLFDNIDIAVAVPLHIERERERGFNQVELIFEDCLKSKNIALERLLLRIKSTEHLVDLKPQERRKELSGAFQIAEDVNIKDKSILILDDIYTTGTTMNECAKILESAGAAAIYGLVLSSDFTLSA